MQSGWMMRSVAGAMGAAGRGIDVKGGRAGASVIGHQQVTQLLARLAHSSRPASSDDGPSASYPPRTQQLFFLPPHVQLPVSFFTKHAKQL